MRTRFAAACALVLLGGTAAHGEEVFKCTTHEGVVYQATPCDDASKAETLVVPSTPKKVATVGTIAAPVSELYPPASMPPSVSVADRERIQVVDCGSRARNPAAPLRRRSGICLGMTDDEVLNLPGWGRPAKIARDGARRAWREEWTYESRSGATRQLHFLNGRLVIVDDAASPPAVPAATVVTASTT
jgi:hypothetical protein